MPIRVSLDRVLLERRMSLTELADRVGDPVEELVEALLDRAHRGLERPVLAQGQLSNQIQPPTRPRHSGQERHHSIHRAGGEFLE